MIVYTHTRNDSDQIFYVGISKSIRRAYSHNDRNRHWKGIVNKHGHQVQIVHECESWEEAQYTERYLIGYYGRRDLNNGILVNMTDGGEGSLGMIHSEKTKEIISIKKSNPSEELRAKCGIANIGKTPWNKGKKSSQAAWNKGIKGKAMTAEIKAKISATLKGRPCPTKGIKQTPESNAKRSAANTGKKRSPETCAKIAAALRGKKHTDERRANISASKRRSRPDTSV